MTTPKPDWIKTADRVVDVTDVWLDATDPGNERGEVCLAYFKRMDVPCVDEAHNCFDGSGFDLTGLSIRDTTGTIYRDREWAMKIIGFDSVWRIEQSEMEAA